LVLAVAGVQEAKLQRVVSHLQVRLSVGEMSVVGASRKLATTLHPLGPMSERPVPVKVVVGIPVGMIDQAQRRSELEAVRGRNRDYDRGNFLFVQSALNSLVDWWVR